MPHILPLRLFISPKIRGFHLHPAYPIPYLHLNRHLRIANPNLNIRQRYLSTSSTMPSTTSLDTYFKQYVGLYC
jgi:hypothetical protein